MSSLGQEKLSSRVEPTVGAGDFQLWPSAFAAVKIAELCGIE
jgi:hypothetical protein